MKGRMGMCKVELSRLIKISGVGGKKKKRGEENLEESSPQKVMVPYCCCNKKAKPHNFSP